MITKSEFLQIMKDQGAQMQNIKNWDTQRINAEFNRLLTLAMNKGFASTKQRSFFYALREEWNRRQRINYN